MTLKELYSQVRGRKGKGQLGKYQLLARHERQLAKYVTTMGEGTIKVSIRVFESGYVLYEEDEKFTVFHLSEIVGKCTEYDTTDGSLVSRKQRTVPAEAFMSSEWYLKILLDGNDRIMHNREKVAADHTEFSYSGISEDMAQLGITEDFLQKIIKEIDHQKMLDVLEVVKNSMKSNKWEVFVKIKGEGKTQAEIAPLFGKTQQAVSRDYVDAVDFTPNNKDYSYTADDLMNYYEDKDIRNLIVINPDNPSGNYIPRVDLLKLIDWSKRKGIRLIIDESFVDFADEIGNTLIVQNILNENRQLIVMKSISKSYGVPGLRLGVLASGDEEIIAKLKKDVAIWNINSFGEFYMQIEEKYKKDYATALVQIREERSRFQNELANIKGVRVIPSQANFVMVELEDGISPKDLLKRLLIKHNLLIKELTTKTNGRNYLRLAVRNTEDNNVLLSAMKVELEQSIKG